MPNKPKLICLDFDGTICLKGWPDINAGQVNPRCLERIRKEKQMAKKFGYRLYFILWTCRGQRKGDLLDAARWCRKNKIPISCINRNHYSVFDWGYTGGDSPKPYADEYWDDKAVRIS